MLAFFKSFILLDLVVPRGGIEPPTRGFSIFLRLCSFFLKAIQAIAITLFVEGTIASMPVQIASNHFIPAWNFCTHKAPSCRDALWAAVINGGFV